MGSHALLLRLFLSNSFFSVHVALQYLRLYADNIGITHYLTSRLRELPTRDLWDVWGFLCHLLVTRPSRSVALECFVVERAEESTHIALLTLWFMQASLNDLASTHRYTQSFVVCQRILHKCHAIIFGDLPPPVPAPYASLAVPSRSRFLRKKVKPRVEAALVGMGTVLAGAPGMPCVVEVVGSVAVAQGRWEDAAAVRRLPLDVAVDEDAAPLAQSSRRPSAEGVASDEDEDEDGTQPSKQLDAPVASASKSTAPVVSQRGQQRRAVGAAQTSPVLPMSTGPGTSHRSMGSDDPLGQLLREDPPRDVATTPYRSSPTIMSIRRPTRSSASVDFMLQKYDLYSQELLLRGHYLRGEVQFLLGLETIASRLLVVPRPARISALRAELTNLNHKLPAEVCIPMWCESSDAPRPNGSSEPHHRVVRIPPGESVVLNSAERAPYLLVIEILHGDLDFDPSKRENAEILRKVVLDEAGKKVTKGPSRQVDLADESGNKVLASVFKEETTQDILGHENGDMPSIGALIPPTPLDGAHLADEDEEVDVTDQLDRSARSQNEALNDSIALPSVPKNKELDMQAWSKRSSTPPSPSFGPQHTQTPIMDQKQTSFESSALDKHVASSGESHSPDSSCTTRVLSLEDYSERMRTAAVMLAQLNANVVLEPITSISPSGTVREPPVSSTSPGLSWIPGSSWLPSLGSSVSGSASPDASSHAPPAMRMRLQRSEADSIRARIMEEMLALEGERMERMRAPDDGQGLMSLSDIAHSAKIAEDESIIRRELNKVDPSAAVFREAWATKKSRIRASSPYGYLANWDCVSVIVKTGADLRQEQLAVQLIKEFERIWKEENCDCWVRPFHILITGGTSGLVETITDAVSIHSLKKAEYARRLAEGRLGYVTLMDHFISTYGDPSSAKFARARRNFVNSLAGYSLVTYLLQIKDRHNGNILLDRDGHLLHIDFGFMLSNSPGNIGFEAAPFKLPSEYIEVLGGIDSEHFRHFKRLFHEGFEAARKHCDRIINIVELMQKDSALPCFASLGEQTAQSLRERFQPTLTHSLVGEYVERLIVTSVGSAWTRLYDSYQYYSQSIL